MFRFGLRTVSQYFLAPAAKISKCILPAQSAVLNSLQPAVLPGRTIFTLLKSPVMSPATPSSLLQTSSILKESRRNQGNSKVSHFKPCTRDLRKFTLGKGKPRTERVVLLKFYRLHWGGWIRTIQGRHKKMYYKSTKNKKRSSRHVFCNAQQCTLLDNMTTKFWKRPKHYIDDPYEPYHTREEFPFTRTKPREFHYEGSSLEL